MTSILRHSNYKAKFPEGGAISEIEWYVSIKRAFNEVDNEVEKYIQNSSEHLTSSVRNIPPNTADEMKFQRVELPHFSGDIHKTGFTRNEVLRLYYICIKIVSQWNCIWFSK